MPSLRSLCLASLCALLVAGCGRDVAQQRTLKLSDCRLPHLSTAAQCSALEVPEDRAKPDGRKITIFAALLPANTVTPK